MASQYKDKAAESGGSGLYSKKIFYTIIVVHIFVNKTKEKSEGPRPDLFGLFPEFWR